MYHTLYGTFFNLHFKKPANYDIILIKRGDIITTYKNNYQIALALSEKVKLSGGIAFFVGGYVRDKILGVVNKDIDIEVHNLPSSKLEEIIDSLGKRIEIGKSFGIYNIKGFNIDIALPRSETVKGLGHKDFDIEVDPFIGTYKAALRRDFTINALMENVLTGEIIDHFNGISDIKNKIIRHVNATTFTEDPLRVLRACQFASRLEFSICEETVRLCRGIDISKLSKERIEEELKKALLKASKPSIFFQELRRMLQLSNWFLELEMLIGVRQNHLYHLEGDVWNHTMLVIDEAAKLRDKVSNPYAFMLSALCHDIGKAVTTVDVEGNIHSYRHEIAGIPLIKTFLNRFTNEKDVIKYVINMTKLHMRPSVLAVSKAKVKVTNRLFDEAVAPLDLIYLSMADGSGQIRKDNIDSGYDFLIDRLNIYQEMMAKPHVTGSDLIACGLVPNQDFKKILQFAHKLRLAGINKECALKQTIGYANSIKNNKTI